METVDDQVILALEAAVVLCEDVSGLKCPMPILRTKKALAKIEGGQLLKVLTTDASAVTDLSVFAQQTGHLIKAQVQLNDVVTHYIEKRV